MNPGFRDEGTQQVRGEKWPRAGAAPRDGRFARRTHDFGPTCSSRSATASRRATEDVPSPPGPPRDAHQVAGVGEHAPDVVRSVRELVTRIRVVPPLDADAVEAAPAVRVDQAAEKTARVLTDEHLLPVGQHDRAPVLGAGTVLREETGPVPVVGADRDAGHVATRIDARSLAGHDRGDGAAPLLDDPGIGRVECEPQRQVRAVTPQATVAEIETEELGVVVRERSRVAKAAAVRTRGGTGPSGKLTSRPPGNRGLAYPSGPRHLVRAQSHAVESEDLLDGLDGEGATAWHERMLATQADGTAGRSGRLGVLGALAQLARAPVSKTGGSRFESWMPRRLRSHPGDGGADAGGGIRTPTACATGT